VFYLRYDDAWVMQAWCVYTKRLLTFAGCCVVTFNMEKSGKLKRCLEEAWPQYGFTVLCEVTYCYMYRVYLSRCLLVVDLKTM
jgi:hypothetical protein